MQLRDNRRIRETFGKYIDPRVVEGLINRPNLTAAEGQRRVMTVLFCDLKGFTSLCEGMTPTACLPDLSSMISQGVVMPDLIRAFMIVQRGLPGQARHLAAVQRYPLPSSRP